MSAPLDSRVVRIVRWLLAQDAPASTAQLATDLVLTERAVRYRLSAVENFLLSHGVSLQRQRGAGLSIVGDDGARAQIAADLDAQTAAPRVYAPGEREHLLLDALLWNHPNTLSLEQVNEELEVSTTSARRDLKKCEPWLERMGLPVVRKPGHGIALLGSEQRVRRALVQLFLQAVPGDVLDELMTGPLADASLLKVRVPAGLRDRLGCLPIERAAKAIRESPVRDRLARSNGELIYTLYLSITMLRVASGRAIELEPGELAPLQGLPVSSSVHDLADTMHFEDGSVLDEGEIAGLTEYLLGFEALVTETVSLKVEQLVSSILDHASQELHVNLVDDHELRQRLERHLTRLTVRLRYGLPVYNPIRSQVAGRYPEVQAVAEDLSGMLVEHFGVPLQADEIGFITIYLAGAIDRGHLQPRRRAMVVCPSGMAVGWMLMSRLHAEFPALGFVEVPSPASYEQTDDLSDIDFIISTVPLVDRGVPVVVVGPVISQSDVRLIAGVI